MNKAELIAAVAAAAEISKKDAETAVSATLDAITAALKEGDKVQLVGFGSFEVKSRAYSIACSWLGKVARYSMVLPPLGILGLCPIPYYAKSAPLPCPAPGWAMPHRMRKYSTCFCRWGVVQ